MLRRVPDQEWRDVEVVGIDMVDEGILLWEVKNVQSECWNSSVTVNLGGVARMPCWYITSCELVFSSTMKRLFKTKI